MVIYLSCANDIATQWMANINATKTVQLLENKTDIFNYSTTSADIFILDIDSFNDIKEVLTFLNTLPKSLKVIVVRRTLNFAEGTLLIKKGVKSYCHYLVSKKVLERIIKTVEVGDTWVYPALMNYIIKNITINDELELGNKSLDKLSKKEKEVALLVASGHSNQEIANNLDVTLINSRFLHTGTFKEFYAN